MTEVTTAQTGATGTQQTTGTTTAQTGAAGTQQTTTADTGSFAWDKAGLDTETLGWVQSKGFKDLPSTLNSHRNLEKLTGAGLDRLVQLPKDDAPDAWNAVYDKLGRPKTADEYKLPVPEGDKGEFAKIASGWMHEAGLNPRQAQLVATKWNDFAKAQQTATRTESAQKAAADEVTLKQEWGAKFDDNVGLAKRAAQQLFKLDGATIDKLEGAIGHAGVMKLMHAAGTKLGVDDGVIGMDGGKPNGFNALTPAAAQSRIAELRKDAGWMAGWTNGDASKRAEMNRLVIAASGGS